MAGMKMRKVVINTVYGGFGLSHEAFLRLRELGQPDALAEPDIGELYSDGSGPRRARVGGSFGMDVPRDDAILVQIVEEMGAAASAAHANLAVVEIPDEVQWEIAEYDGLEWIAEKHRTWG